MKKLLVTALLLAASVASAEYQWANVDDEGTIRTIGLHDSVCSARDAAVARVHLGVSSTVPMYQMAMTHQTWGSHMKVGTGCYYKDTYTNEFKVVLMFSDGKAMTRALPVSSFNHVVGTKR